MKIVNEINNLLEGLFKVGDKVELSRDQQFSNVDMKTHKSKMFIIKKGTKGIVKSVASDGIPSVLWDNQTEPKLTPPVALKK